MNRTEQIKSIAAKLLHNIEAREAIRIILDDKINKGEQESIGIKAYRKQYLRADGNIQDLRYDLGELNARLTPDGVLEIY